MIGSLVGAITYVLLSKLSKSIGQKPDVLPEPKFINENCPNDNILESCTVLLGDVGGTNVRLSLRRLYYNDRSKSE